MSVASAGANVLAYESRTDGLCLAEVRQANRSRPMIFKDAERVLAVLLSFVLTTASSRIVYGYQAPSQLPAAGPKPRT